MEIRDNLVSHFCVIFGFDLHNIVHNQHIYVCYIYALSYGDNVCLICLWPKYNFYYTNISRVEYPCANIAELDVNPP